MAQNSCYDNDIQNVLMKSDISSKNLSQEDAETKLVQYGPSELVNADAFNPPMMFPEPFRRPMAMLSMISAVAALGARTKGLRNSGGD
ncbi:MAG: hypothetical protein C4K48_07015 [Candidatus Thorarchaeota archaeon]|nr:MAG: hypothetical protein C4K48_07015 [Candidatus Thorarchaeota archaeon]